MYPGAPLEPSRPATRFTSGEKAGYSALPRPPTMSTREHFLARLLELPRIEEPEIRRGVFRQSITALGLVDAAGGPLALAGVDPLALERCLQMVRGDGLLDDLDFIAPSAAAVALYQIAGALPLGAERRAIGRKVLNYLYNGNAETFASLASRMALGSTRPLQGAGIRARISLSMWLRSSADSAIDRLALAIVTRKELAATWVNAGATGSLPDRRLAARLIERAAREAARRATAGDPHPLRIFMAVANPARYMTPPRPDGLNTIAPAWHSLLNDRETLVWRHIAIARGLLCAVVDEFAAETKRHLSPDLGPTEWRRAATSTVARMAVDREVGLSSALALLDGPLLRRDAGIAMSMVWGLTPAAEVEPEAAEELIEAIAGVSPITIADSLVELRAEVRGVGAQAADICASALRNSLASPELDDGLSALARAILNDLESAGDGRELHDALRAALDAFAEDGPREAFALARQAQLIASSRVGQLESFDVRYDAAPGQSESRRQAMTLLRDIDTNLLESHLLSDLLLLDRKPGSGATGVEATDDLDARLAHWLLAPARRSATAEEQKAQSTLHQRQLRALLHLIDSASTEFGDDMDRRMRVRSRWTLAVRALLLHVQEQPKSRLTRAIIATVARSFDALVRDAAAEPIDVFLYVAMHFNEHRNIQIVSEASMHPDTEQLLASYLAFVKTEHTGTPAEQAKGLIAGFRRFLEGFPSQRTLRSEAFRTTAWRLVWALESVWNAGSLAALVSQESGAGTPLAAIEDAIAQLNQLMTGAERRCCEEVSRHTAVPPQRHVLANAVEQAVNTDSDTDLLDAVTNTVRVAAAMLPPPMAELVNATLPRLTTLARDRTSVTTVPLVVQNSLPDWIPARRILGGFYVMKQLGGGNVGTVFVVKRAEDRHDPDAQQFALKVPEYNATAARTMSETEFLRMFREEAGALLSIPEHHNIASFVTFDAGARPKPILVMELIGGVSCERVINTQSLNVAQAISVLDGTMAGLEAMHSTGIAHLDVKPSNSILRVGTSEPVLVDFGLSGRHIRPGCATLCYGAPEIWETAAGQAVESHAWAADVYAFGCFAYEVLTGLTLFDGTSDVGIISAHITHDGLPAPVNRMAQTPGLQGLAMFLYQCLRYNPAHRGTMTQLRQELRKVSPEIMQSSWPLRAD
jgi:hypothetical protein